MKGQGKEGAVRSLRDAGGGSAGSTSSTARGVSALELGARKESIVLARSAAAAAQRSRCAAAAA
eukprot:3111696-Pleurochrysis_carterae.AAC.1